MERNTELEKAFIEMLNKYHDSNYKSLPYGGKMVAVDFDGFSLHCHINKHIVFASVFKQVTLEKYLEIELNKSTEKVYGHYKFALETIKSLSLADKMGVL